MRTDAFFESELRGYRGFNMLETFGAKYSERLIVALLQ
jgi:hypothetical protein